MRFPLAALFFLVMSFIFFVSWAVASFLINATKDAMTPLAADLGSAEYDAMLVLLPTAFGVICVIFFLVGILLIFVMESLADEPEYYTRPPGRY